MKNIPTGLGIWIWQIKNCSGGNWDTIIQQCLDSGINWIAVKNGDNVRNIQWTTSVASTVIPKIHQAGLKIYGWNYSTPQTVQSQIPFITECLEEGLDGHFIDAEIEWQNLAGSDLAAKNFMSELRASIGDVFLAHAPFSIVNYHSTFPYTSFNQYCDQVADQLYWTQFDWSVEYSMSLADQAWQQFYNVSPSANIPRCPIGVTYGGNNYPNVPGIINPVDVGKFLDHYANCQAVSLYSYDACYEPVWELLKSRKITTINPPLVIAPTMQPAPIPMVPVPIQPSPPPTPPQAPVAQTNWLDKIGQIITTILLNIKK